MSPRRLLTLAAAWAAGVLPVWVLVGRGLLVADSSWDLLGYVLLAPVLAAVLGVAALLVRLRRPTPEAPLRWADAALLSLWYADLIAFGVVPEPWDGPLFALGVLLAAGSIAFLAWELVRDTRRRVRETLAAFEQQTRRPAATAGPSHGPGGEGSATGPAATGTASRTGASDPVIRMRRSGSGWRAG